MKKGHLLLSAAVLAMTVSCSSVLDVVPTTSVPDDAAIIDKVSAEAALAGMYDALQSTSYYGEVHYTWGELSSDNASHTGTFTSYADADLAVITSDNTQIEATWDAIYQAINRANVLIQKVPGVPGMTQAEKDDIIGQAYFVRALAHHDLLKRWGGVPIKTAPVASIDEASDVTRATVAEVYTQILADLTQAENLITSATRTRNASDGSVRALRARVLLYRASSGVTGSNDGQWAGVEAAATSVMTMGYSLATNFVDLWSGTGQNTPEDIFRLRFTDQDPFWAGYYFLVKSLGGRYEVGATTSIRNAYETGDARLAATVKADPTRATRFYGAKFPTPEGTEHPHVMRLAEVVLIRAEARARQGNLPGAISDYNMLRTRAGLAPHVLGVNVVTQADVLNAIARERRSELAFEGDRWPDLIRSGSAVAVMTAHRAPSTFAAHQVLYPIPQNEIDVTKDAAGANRLTQNSGY